jgi:hypothetical protein
VGSVVRLAVCRFRVFEAALCIVGQDQWSGLKESLCGNKCIAEQQSPIDIPVSDFSQPRANNLPLLE